MKYIALALLLAGCCPDAVTKTETTRSERDSVSTKLVEKKVFAKGDSATVYPDTAKSSKDSTLAPTNERLTSPDGKYTVDINRRNPKSVTALVTVQGDSIKMLIAENTYWKWLAENTKETTTQKKFIDMALSEIVFSGLIALCLILAVVIIARWGK